MSLRRFVKTVAEFAAIVVAGAAVWGLKLSRDSLNEATSTNQQSMSIAKAALDEAKATNQQIVAHAKESLDESTKSNAKTIAVASAALEDERKERERVARVELSPYLSISQCCNPTAIRLPTLSNPSQLGILLADERDKKGPDAEHINWGFVARLTNLGRGAATSAEAHWHPTRIKYTDGTEFRPIPGADADERRFRLYTVPREIPAGGHAEVQHLPSCIYDDATLRVEYVEGTIELTCEDISGKQNSFTYQFELQPAYDPTRYNRDDPPRIFAHIEKYLQVDGPFPHPIHPSEPQRGIVVPASGEEPIRAMPKAVEPPPVHFFSM